MNWRRARFHCSTPACSHEHQVVPLWQVIAMLTHLFDERRHSHPAIIVVPASLVANW